MKHLLVGLAIVLTVTIGFAMFFSKSPKPQKFTSFDGVNLCFFDNGGDGRPVILLHGLLVDSQINFGLDAYRNTGRRTILLDARGHGCSDKPHDPKAYAGRAMARDVLSLIEHLELQESDILGYSMGGYTAIEAALIDDTRIGTLIIGGIGNSEGDEAWFRERADEMLSDPPPDNGFYRQLADDVSADRKAIAAWFQGAEFPQIREAEDLSQINAMVHILNASEDEDPATLAARFREAYHSSFQGDHISVLENPEYVSSIEKILTTNTN